MTVTALTHDTRSSRTAAGLVLAVASATSFGLSGALARAGTPPEHLHVSATVTFDKVDDAWTVTASQIDVVGHAILGLDQDQQAQRVALPGTL